MADLKPIADVAHPNKSAPSSNSKSVIITHGPRIQDPMVNAIPPRPLTAPLISSTDTGKTELKIPEPVVAEETDKAETKLVPTRHTKLPLKPLPVVEDKEIVSEPEEATPEESAPDDMPTKDITEEVNNDAIDGEKAKAEAALQKLVESKQYFLPINTLEKRRSRQFVVISIILSLVMIIAWFDIALDAGLITIDGVKPLTHLFTT